MGSLSEFHENTNLINFKMISNENKKNSIKPSLKTTTHRTPLLCASSKIENRLDISISKLKSNIKDENRNAKYMFVSYAKFLSKYIFHHIFIYLFIFGLSMSKDSSVLFPPVYLGHFHFSIFSTSLFLLVLCLMRSYYLMI